MIIQENEEIINNTKLEMSEKLLGKLILNNKYRVFKRIGGGTFGDVFRV